MKINSRLLKDYFQAKEIISSNLPETVILHTSIDSRLVKSGDTFVCIQGEKTDGHHYIDDAIKNGAIGFIVNRKIPVSANYFQILVDSPEAAIQKAAARILKETNIKQIVITGSAGKTTTKEITFCIFNDGWKTAKTHGNYNTPIGVPISIINMDEQSSFFLCELSASYPGEIDQNLDFMNLEAGVITGIGSSHLEFFGSTENIFDEKMKIVKHINATGCLLINGDQPWGDKAKKQYQNTLTFGFDKNNDIQAFSLKKDHIGTTFSVRIKDEILADFTVSTFGDHFIYDSLPGIFLAKMEGMSMEKIRQALCSFKAEKGRGKIIPWLKNSTIIDESYNANPFSFTMSINSFSNYQFSRKIAIIGDMLELGSDSERLHVELGKQLGNSDIQIIIYKGHYQEAVKRSLEDFPIQFYGAKSLLDIEQYILSVLKEGDGILIKASNGVGLHDLVRNLEKYR